LRSLASTLNDAPNRYSDAVDAVMIVLLTGCRSGESLRLRWTEVEEAQLKLTRTKTDPRNVSLTTPVKARLEASNKLMTTIGGSWKTLKRLAGLPEDIRLRDLRHTYPSHSIMSGEILAITGKLLGHKSARSTEVYAHLDAGYLSLAADKVSNRLIKAMQ